MKTLWLPNPKKGKGKKRTAKKQKKRTLEDLKTLYKNGEHKELARILPHLRNEKDPFVEKLLEGRILTMGKELQKLEKITVGADPEFILKSKKTHETILFSSEHIKEDAGICMSEAALGADYGLLELRPEPEEEVDRLIAAVSDMIGFFHETYTEVEIDETEAVVFDHQKERLRALMDNNEIDFGINQVRKFYVADLNSVNIEDESSYRDLTLSAYDEPLMFQPRDDLLTAGGHIHIGGTFVRLLSFEQLKGLIRKIDAEVGKLCEEVETAAGKIRREVYGNKGEFRVKPYGFEYRTPSNAIFWPKNQKTLKTVLDTMFKLTKESLL